MSENRESPERREEASVPAPPGSAQPPAEYPPPQQAPPYWPPPQLSAGHAYPGPSYAPYYAQPATTNGMAVASLALGIAGLVFVLPVLGSILALVFGYVGKKQIDRSRGAETGRGMAIAGIVLGWIGVVLAVVATALIIIAVAASDPSDSFDPGFSALAR